MSIKKMIDLIENRLSESEKMETEQFILDSSENLATFNGLVRLKKEIGDEDLSEHIKSRTKRLREQAFKQLFHTKEFASQ